MFQKIDDFLFDKIFQPLADWSVTHLGKNCFWWAANLFVPVAIIDLINGVEHINRIVDAGKLGYGYIAFDSVLLTLWIIVLIVWTALASQKINIEETTTANEFRPLYFFLRMFLNLLGFSVLIISIILFSTEAVNINFWHITNRVSDFLLFVGMYMFASEVRPPSKETELKLSFQNM